MNHAWLEPRWPKRRWAVFTLLILTGQLTLIFWLSGKPLITSQAIPFAPHVLLPVNASQEWSLLESPTLYVLPNRHGFSEAAWMEMPSVQKDLPGWTEAPRPLALPVDKLGGALATFVKTNSVATFAVTPPPEPDADIIVESEFPGTGNSRLTLEGGLARRKLVSQFKLGAWPATDVLTNSIVLTGVDGQGSVFSAVLLSGSGSKDADAKAVALANAAQFEPLRGNPDGANRMSWGWMVFHWQTTPAGTNMTTP